MFVVEHFNNRHQVVNLLVAALGVGEGLSGAHLVKTELRSLQPNLPNLASFFRQFVQQQLQSVHIVPFLPNPAVERDAPPFGGSPLTSTLGTMPVLARNTIAFFVAVASYIGGFRAIGYILSLFDVHVGFGAFILFHCAFGVVGYFLFRGSSRSVLVLFAAIISAVALNVVIPDPVAASDPRNTRVQVFVWASMGILAAIATNITDWVAEWIYNSRFGPPMEEVKESKSLAKQKSTLGYRLGKWVGHRRPSSRREK